MNSGGSFLLWWGSPSANTFANAVFQRSCGIGDTIDRLLPEDIAETVLYVAELPQRAVVEDVTVWGIDKQVNPL
ncbi:MAG: hypothetical protein IJO28_06995 [Oscillospiraceae bacterium]|nr:hypothetical protein [Oscillospiraceae bacterium]